MTLHDSGNSPMGRVISGTGVSPVSSGHYLLPVVFHRRDAGATCLLESCNSI